MKPRVLDLPDRWRGRGFRRGQRCSAGHQAGQLGPHSHRRLAPGGYRRDVASQQPEMPDPPRQPDRLNRQVG